MTALEKMIKVSEEAYERLNELRREGESLTDVILRKVPPKEEKDKIMDLFGAWDGDEEEFQEIFGDILKGRRDIGTRDLEALEWSA
jgi:predicted CopG family antitoxin